MKISIFIGKLLFFLMACLMTLSTAQAAKEWFTTDVLEIQTHNRSDKSPKIYVRLDDAAGSPAFIGMRFILPSKARKEMMATLLAAVTNGFQVNVRVDLSEGGTPEVQDIVLVVPVP